MDDMNAIRGLGRVSIRAIENDYPRPASSSIYDQWGEMAPEVRDMVIERWIVELTPADGSVVEVGDLSAHAVWYGPTPGSRALNIGISLVEAYRGEGIGSIAQRLLAQELHLQGIVRVEAQTDVENIAEKKSLEKAGFLFEGLLHRAQQRADGFHDIEIWSHVAK
ncbi:MAG: GNAT family protein [Candidatus Nanopelagicaceae bacterium]|nr:GNAT family protein [Candidatus Nanopelagicaceae bacterium]